MRNIIEIEHLSKSFGDVKAVQDISFCVKEGELFAFLGVNGAGKSTLLKAIIDNELLSEGIGEEKFNIYKEIDCKVQFPHYDTFSMKPRKDMPCSSVRRQRF